MRFTAIVTLLAAARRIGSPSRTPAPGGSSLLSLREQIRRTRALLPLLLVGYLVVAAYTIPDTRAQGRQAVRDEAVRPNVTLEWNQIFIDTLIATKTPNSSSQRLGAIVHIAMFDAYNGVTQEYVSVFYGQRAPEDANVQAAVVAAGYTAILGLFPTRKVQLDASYAASMAALGTGGGDGADKTHARGIEYGTAVANAVLSWRAADGISAPVPAFTGGSATGQWRPTPPASAAMSALTLAFTRPFVLDNTTQFRPQAPRARSSRTYADDFNAVKALGRRTDSTRTEDQTALAPFWEGNATVHWNQAANQAARANKLDLAKSTRLLTVLNVAMADAAITTWSAKRSYGADTTACTWRPVTAIPLADSDGNPDTAADPHWLPLVDTPSHPEYPAGHPSLNGAAATVMLSEFNDAQTFTLTTPNLPDRTYSSISKAREDGNNARVWGGMHYPSTVTISDAMGQAIAQHVNASVMQRRNRLP